MADLSLALNSFAMLGLSFCAFYFHTELNKLRKVMAFLIMSNAAQRNDVTALDSNGKSKEDIVREIYEKLSESIKKDIENNS